MISIVDRILAHSCPVYAKGASKFFKTKYTSTEHVGIRVPAIRSLAKQFVQEDSDSMLDLIRDNRHEIRFTGLLMMVETVKIKDRRYEIVDLYLKNIQYVNNWDLVDGTCPTILGSELLLNSSKPLQNRKLNIFTPHETLLSQLPVWYRSLYTSDDHWQVRISIVSLLPLIKNDMLVPVSILLQGHLERLSMPNYTLHIGGKKYEDNDLIHKAIGWLLREIGKKDKKLLCDILEKNLMILPRTTLRYSIERLAPSEISYYLKMPIKKQ